MTGPVWAIVVAGGVGTRFGAAKQWSPLAGRRVIDWSVAAAAEACDGVVLVVPLDDVGRDDLPSGCSVVSGGATRSASVRAGLAAVPSDAAIVLVHDAARPLASGDLFRRMAAAINGGAPAALAAVPVTDTIKRVGPDGRVVATPDRAELWAAQTPQAFRAAVLRAAHACGADATDDAALVEALGHPVIVVMGEVANRKITDPDDLVVAEALLGR